MYQDRRQMEIEEMEQCSSDIQQGPLEGLGTVYEHIYTEHHQENPVEYTLHIHIHTWLKAVALASRGLAVRMRSTGRKRTDCLQSICYVTTFEALVSDHLGNSEKWSQLELVAYENGLF